VVRKAAVQLAAESRRIGAGLFVAGTGRDDQGFVVFLVLGMQLGGSVMVANVEI
jgi:hypothetical protein